MRTWAAILGMLALMACASEVERTRPDGTSIQVHPMAGSTSVCFLLCWHTARFATTAGAQ